MRVKERREKKGKEVKEWRREQKRSEEKSR